MRSAKKLPDYWIFICATAIASASTATRASILIDGFTQGSINLSASSAYTPVGQNESGVDTLGGNRAESLFRYYDDGGSSTMTLSTGGPLNINGTYSYASLGYGYVYSGGGFDGYPAGDLNADFSNTTELDFNFSAVSAPVVINLTLDTDDGNGNYGYLTNNNPGDNQFVVSSPGDYFIPYTQLQNEGINLSKIDDIDVNLESYGSFSLAKLSATNVPEPASIATIMLAPAAIFLHRRKKDRPS